jgi:hypothetical protein
MVNIETITRNSDPQQVGVFVLAKCVFLIEGENTGSTENGRCDNLAFNGVPPTEGTEYASHSHSIHSPSVVSESVIDIAEIVTFEYIVSVVPHFYIRYIELSKWFDSEKDLTPSTMWGAKSMFQLFKNMREWSFMVEEPFNSDHPMATYSKLALDTLDPPQSILDEIDLLPDMHLAKFLKGQEDYKLIPHPYPEVSEEFKNWVIQLTIDYPEKSFEDLLEEI